MLLMLAVSTAVLAVHHLVKLAVLERRLMVLLVLELMVVAVVVLVVELLQ